MFCCMFMFLLTVSPVNYECTPGYLIDSLIKKETSFGSGVAIIEVQVENWYLLKNSGLEQNSATFLFIWNDSGKFRLEKVKKDGNSLLIAYDGKYILTRGKVLWDDAYLYHLNGPHRDRKGLLERFELDLSILTELVMGHIMPFRTLTFSTDRTNDNLWYEWCYYQRTANSNIMQINISNFINSSMRIDNVSPKDSFEFAIVPMFTDNSPPQLSVSVFADKNCCTINRLILKDIDLQEDLEYFTDPSLSDFPSHIAHGKGNVNSQEFSWKTKLIGWYDKNSLDNKYIIEKLRRNNIILIDAESANSALSILYKMDLLDIVEGTNSIKFNWGSAYNLNLLQRIDWFIRRSQSWGIQCKKNHTSVYSDLLLIRKYRYKKNLDRLLLTGAMYIDLLIIIDIGCIIIYIIWYCFRKFFIKKKGNSGTSIRWPRVKG